MARNQRYFTMSRAGKQVGMAVEFVIVVAGTVRQAAEWFGSD